MGRMPSSTAWVAGVTLWQWQRHTPSPPKSGATGGFQVKTITIRLSDVEAAMLIEVRKNDKGFRDLNELLRELIHREFFKSPSRKQDGRGLSRFQ